MPDVPHSIPAPATTATESRVRLSPLLLSWLANGWCWAFLALGICWFFLFVELSEEWQINAQYNYGYVVPLLGLALIWRRWPERPRAVPTPSNWIAYAGAALLVLLPMIRLVLRANPEWRLLYWLHGLQAVALSFCFLYWIGGGSWVRFFAAPIVFMLIAVPWPMGFEQWAVQNLMRLVAGLTVEVAGLFGIPAVQQGNLIETTGGIVGIDEACSGVRSLQSALMLSLFLGEMHRLSAGRRVGLLGASLLFDLLANLARTTFLVWAAASRGLTQMEAWHDTAGLLVMIIVLPSLLGLAYLMKPRTRRVPGSHPVSVGETGAVPSLQKSPQHALQRSLPTVLPLPFRRGEGRGEGSFHVAYPVVPSIISKGDRTGPSWLPPIPRWAGILAVLWIGVGEAASEAWYRVHETQLIAAPRWSVAWPTQNPRFRKTAVPENALAILRCSDSAAATWEDDAGNQWSAFILRWKPGKNSAQLAKGHRPDICFPAAGAHLLDDFGQVSVPIQNFEIPFHHETFDTGGKIVNVFYCLWSDRISPDETPLAKHGPQMTRLLAVLAGKRNLGQQELEVVLAGPETRNDAVAAFKTTLPALIQMDQTK